MKIGMVYDLRDDYLKEGFTEEAAAEFDSEETVAVIEKTLCELGYTVERIGNCRKLCNRLTSGARWDLVFNFSEGVNGRSREAQSPAVLELFEIPYTFSDPLVCALTLDKSMTKKIILNAGLSTPKFAVIRSEEEIEGALQHLKYPIFAKPLCEGTGKGIDSSSLIENRKELKRTCLRILGSFSQPVLLEEFLPGREFTVGILGTGKYARVVGIMEITLIESAPGNIYSYESKEFCEKLIRYTPFRESPLKEEIERLALAAYCEIECRDAGRIDLRLDEEGHPSFIEINVLPGLHPTHSDLPMLAEMFGVSYKELIREIVDSALSRGVKCHEGVVCADCL